MKTIATINFKGGVGKTTATWCLGDVLSRGGRAKVLLFDLDAQMSLTQAISLKADGDAHAEFVAWGEKSAAADATIIDALQRFLAGDKFDFAADDNFVYRLNGNYHFVPSNERLYWLGQERIDAGKGKFFIKELLGRIANADALPRYDYALFDCPPSFSLLSYSVLTCCDLILVPMQPDFYAARGIELLLRGLREQIKPHPLPTTVVFANRVRTWRRPTRLSRQWMGEVGAVCAGKHAEGMDVHYLDAVIPDRAALRDAVTERETPEKHIDIFLKLWNETRGKLK